MRTRSVDAAPTGRELEREGTHQPQGDVLGMGTADRGRAQRLARGRRVAAAALAVALVLPGCATKRLATTGFPEVPATASHGRDSARLRVSGLDIRVEALDKVQPRLVGKEEVDAPLLKLRLRFHAKELGFAFDPRRVVFRRGAHTFPARLSSGAGCEDSGVLSAAQDGRLWLKTRACLVLAFDASVTNGPGQELVIDGLSLGQQPIPPRRLPLVRRQVAQRELTPGARRTLGKVLMVPLYILLLPVYGAGGGM